MFISRYELFGVDITAIDIAPLYETGHLWGPGTCMSGGPGYVSDQGRGGGGFTLPPGQSDTVCRSCFYIYLICVELYLWSRRKQRFSLANALVVSHLYYCLCSRH